MEEREKLLRKLNNAFAECDVNFLADSVINEIQWEIVGEKTISGRREFEKALERMKVGGAMDIKVRNLLIHEEQAVVEGIVEFNVEPGKKRKYAFCDIYLFSESGNKVKELRTYVTQIKKA